MCGIIYKYKNLKKYILWTLKLLEDMPGLFYKVDFVEKEGMPQGRYDIYLVDDVESFKQAVPREKQVNSIVIHFKNTVVGDDASQ